MLFLPAQQELDCISDSGRILGKIKFDGAKDEYSFYSEDKSIALTDVEKSSIAERLASLISGQSSIAMQDED
ncbi:hypothetical protein [Marinomonas sp. 2405UD68-3]|uniref:hypothetical protein n=1 Tax=Marinomonas sp. 2405UD68-3 TaxID=3391835 RepID=UPI0039C8EB2B